MRVVAEGETLKELNEVVKEHGTLVNSLINRSYYRGAMFGCCSVAVGFVTLAMFDRVYNRVAKLKV